MKNHTIFQGLIVLLAGTFLSSCRTHGPAFSANTNAYMAKPAYRGKDQGAIYLSGRINGGYEYYEDEKNSSSELAAHVAYTSENLYACGGIYTYFGNYKVNTNVSPVPGGSLQSFNGTGFRLELGGRMPLENHFDVLLGINGEIYGEKGKYAENTSNVFEDIFTFGLSRVNMNAGPVLDFQYVPPGKWDVGARYSLDTYISLSDVLDSGKNNSYLHRLTLHSTYGKLTAFGQVGFTPEQQKVWSAGLSLGIPFQKDKKAD